MRGLWAVIVASVPALLTAAEPVEPARAVERAMQAAIARAETSIALIQVCRDQALRDKFGKSDVPSDYIGSGVVIDGPSRLILTHYHVVRDSVAIQVRLPGPRGRGGSDGPVHRYEAQIRAADPRSDLAILELPNSSTHPLTALDIGRGETLRKGSVVIGLAHPFGSGFRDGSPSATWGVVSNLRRRLPGPAVREEERNKSLTYLGTLIQTDARLTLGTSGGALVDLDGQLVALTTATAALVGGEASGGYAVPLDGYLRRIIEVLKGGDEVEYGFLGVSAPHPTPSGVQINSVTANSPASRAGLQIGDVITKVNGHAVREPEDLYLHVSASLAGTTITIAFLRDSKPQTAEVMLVKFPMAEKSVVTRPSRAVHGLRVDYSSVTARGGMPGGLPEGVVVREVEPNSKAEAAKLEPMVTQIVAVNGQSVNTPAEFYAACDKAIRQNKPVQLMLNNPSRTVTLP